MYLSFITILAHIIVASADNLVQASSQDCQNEEAGRAPLPFPPLPLEVGPL